MEQKIIPQIRYFKNRLHCETVFLCLLLSVENDRLKYNRQRNG